MEVEQMNATATKKLRKDFETANGFLPIHRDHPVYKKQWRRWKKDKRG